MEGFVAQRVEEGVVVELDRLRLRSAAIHDAGRAADEVEAIALTALRERIGDLRGGGGADSALTALAGRVVAGELDPYAAADELVASLT